MLYRMVPGAMQYATGHVHLPGDCRNGPPPPVRTHTPSAPAAEPIVTLPHSPPGTRSVPYDTRTVHTDAVAQPPEHMRKPAARVLRLAARLQPFDAPGLNCRLRLLRTLDMNRNCLPSDRCGRGGPAAAGRAGRDGHQRDGGFGAIWGGLGAR